MSVAGKWIELKDIILSKISQTLKDMYHCFLSYVETTITTKKNNDPKAFV
jgi:hypothetical protein